MIRGFKIAFLLVVSLFQLQHAFALDNICPGEPRTLTWASSNVTGSCQSSASISSCNFNVNPNTAESTEITTSQSCTVALTCDGVTDTDALNVNPNQSRCCGNWALAGQPVWNGSSCIAASPTGDIKANNLDSGATCTIASGASACSVTISYTTQNATNASVWTSDGTGNPAQGTSNAGFNWPWITYGSNVLNLRNGTTNSGTLLDSVTVTGQCATNTTWNSTSGTCQPTATPQPDLIASAITPTTATVGVSTNFASTITNQGSASTVNGFNVLLQWSASSDGSNPVDLRYAFTSFLSAGSFRSVANPITPDVAGTYYLRACADKNAAGDAGAIDEGTNEGNNCGPWTAITVSSTPQPSATLTVPNCTIASGASTCTSSVSWTSSSLTATPSVRQNGTQFSTAGSNTGTSRTLSYGSGASNTFTFVHNSSTLDTKIGTASCASGTTWNGTACAATAPPPETCTGEKDVTVTGATSGGVVYGTSIYTSDSDVSMAAVHYGLIVPGQTATITKKFLGPSSGYVGSTQNGVTSVSYSAEWCAMSLLVNGIDLTATEIRNSTGGVPTGSQGSPMVLYSWVSNRGTWNTFGGFTTLFQKADDSNGSNAQDIGTSVRSTSLESGTAFSTQVTYTPAVSGPMYFRACADKSNAGDVNGVQSEINETNNCGPWTLVNIVSTGPNVSVRADSPVNTLPSSTTTFTFTSSVDDGHNTSCRPLNSSQGNISGYGYVTGTTSVTLKATDIPSAEGEYTYYIKCRDVSHTTASSTDNIRLYVCPAGKTWSTRSRACVLPSDLTAGPVYPTSATQNVQVALSALITNQGGGSTETSFDNFFQMSTLPNGGGTITRLNNDSVNTLAASSSATTSINYTFSSAGTFYLRACADKRNESDEGRINESNENNNCGEWTAFVVGDGSCPLPWGGTLQNGRSVTAYDTASVIDPDRCSNHDETRTCTNGVLSGSYTYQNCNVAPPPAPSISFNITPRTVAQNGLIKLSWSIQNPTNSCSLSAVVQRPPSCNAACESARASEQSSLNSQLTNPSYTNNNDPNGRRLINTALRTAVSGVTARGEKSLNLQYSTTFTLSCGGTSVPVKTIIYVTENNEG